jgi:hypothetical protein
LLVALVALLAACQSDAAAPEAQEVQLAPASQLSAQVRSAPPVVQEAYRFAIANPDVLSKLPCYCGCGNMGHMSNLDCFVQEVKGDGSIVFESHALGWSICVDIARDAMRMLQEGKPLVEIRDAIDREYSQFGPPTHTEPLR